MKNSKNNFQRFLIIILKNTFEGDVAIERVDSVDKSMANKVGQKLILKQKQGHINNFWLTIRQCLRFLAIVLKFCTICKVANNSQPKGEDMMSMRGSVEDSPWSNGHESGLESSALTTPRDIGVDNVQHPSSPSHQHSTIHEADEKFHKIVKIVPKLCFFGKMSSKILIFLQWRSKFKN